MKLFKLSGDVKKELAEIFTPDSMGAVESACGRYLYEIGNPQPGVVEDGQTLIEIAKKAQELRQLLKKNKTALEKVNLHVSEKHGIHDNASFIDDLKEQLKILDNRCWVNPASERALNKKRGRPPGTLHTAERMLAFRLFEIYRRAHGKAAARIVNRENGNEEGPLTLAAAILGPILGLPSNLARYFREIEQDFNGH